ncbi:hypothetical protein RP20_CCG017351 [Aedes albopictus]|nr:hypothetical protein RP20_CCG017351 [Aedes albopictus]
MGTLTCKELHSLAVFSAQKRAIKKRCMDDFCLVILPKSLPNRVEVAHACQNHEGAAKVTLHEQCDNYDRDGTTNSPASRHASPGRSAGPLRASNSPAGGAAGTGASPPKRSKKQSAKHRTAAEHDKQQSTTTPAKSGDPGNNSSSSTPAAGADRRPRDSLEPLNPLETPLRLPKRPCDPLKRLLDFLECPLVTWNPLRPLEVAWTTPDTLLKPPTTSQSSSPSASTPASSTSPSVVDDDDGFSGCGQYPQSSTMGTDGTGRSLRNDLSCDDDDGLQPADWHKLPSFVLRIAVLRVLVGPRRGFTLGKLL